LDLSGGSAVKLLIVLLTLLCLTLTAIPATAGNIYDNGPVNGEVDAFTINFGFSVTDTFTVSNGNGNIGGMNFYAWLFPGDTLESIEVQVGSQAFGNNLMDLTAQTSQSNCFANGFGFNVCQESTTFNGPSLSNGNYWVTLQNGVVTNGDPVFWDQNSGAGCQSQGCPSLAEEYEEGTIPSEAFTLTAQGTTTSTGSTPEPSSILLLASGVIGAAGMLRRKLF
jgi:hypothetical protein